MLTIERKLEIFLKSAEKRRRVKLVYQHIDDPSNVREADVEPIDVLKGRLGIHILCWDHIAGGFRRFAVANMLEVKLSRNKWKRRKAQ